MGDFILLPIILLPFIGALVSLLIGLKNEKYRDIFCVWLTGIELLLISLIFTEVRAQGIDFSVPDIMGTGLHLKLDMFRYMFVWITSLIWFLTTIYSTQYILRYKNRNRYYTFFILTLGSTLGIFMSENILNLFTFFEVMSITSYFLVIHDEDKYTHEAGKTYIEMAITGGLVLLMGLFLLFHNTGTLDIAEIPSRMKDIGNIKYLISSLLIIGFGVKASIVPLHIWLPKAHPAAPAPASAVLSGILVKTGVFGIIITVNIIMDGDLIISSVILVIAFMNMLLGGFLALFQRNIKRILAYSSMSQMGYILLGVGLMGILKHHKEIAIYGVVLHVFNHAMFKVLLFMGAGTIYMIVHDVSINVVRGFGKNQFWLKSVFLIGTLAVMGIPGFNGFISKTILHEALAEAHHMYNNIWFTVAEILFIIASSFTVAYLLKIFVAVFIDNDERYTGQYKNHIRKRALFPMIVLSSLIIFIGLNPKMIINIFSGVEGVFAIHGEFHGNFYNIESIKSTVIVLLLGISIYLILVKGRLLKSIDGKKIYVNPSLKWVSLENDIYIPTINFVFKSSSAFFHVIDKFIIGIVKYITKAFNRLSQLDLETNSKRINSELSASIDKFEDYNNSLKKRREDFFYKNQSISGFLVKVNHHLNSIIYSVFLFATILVLFLVILILLNY